MIYVCMLTWHREEKVRRCLESLLPSLYVNTKVIVLDQGSGNDMRLALSQAAGWHNHVLLWYSRQNAGVAAGRQRLTDRLLGMGLLPGDTVIHMDSDVVIEDVQWLTRLQAGFAAGPRVGAVGIRGCNISAGWEGFGPPLPPGSCDVLSGCLVAYKGSVFLAGCEYPLDFGRFWHEDADLSLQMRALGYDLRCVDDIGVAHDAEHKEGDAQYDANFAKLRERWQGKGLVHIEQEVRA